MLRSSKVERSANRSRNNTTSLKATVIPPPVGVLSGVMRVE